MPGPGGGDFKLDQWLRLLRRGRDELSYKYLGGREKSALVTGLRIFSQDGKDGPPSHTNRTNKRSCFVMLSVI